MNIFIDTSIILQENYFSGKKLERLGTLGNQGNLKIFFTIVVENEIKSKINLDCENLLQAQKTFKRQLDTKYKIIKNLDKSFDFELVNENYVLADLLDKYERFKKFAKIEIIKPNKEFDISQILDNYFKNNPPFSNGNKKHEFPDAISFKIAEDYLKSKNQTGVYLTVDKDFEKLKSNNLTIQTDINELLEQTIKKVNPKIFDDKNHIINAISKDINLFIPGIKAEIELDLPIHHESIFDKHNVEISVDNLDFLEFNIVEYEIFDITENWIGFLCKGNFIADLYYSKAEREEKEKYDRIIQLENLGTNGIVKYKGEFETSCYYEYEFPYQVIKESIEIDEEKSIRNVIRV